MSIDRDASADKTLPAPRGRKRSVTAEAAVLDAAYTLLLHEGLQATTIEAIAARAQVSKVTIYKWWPNRAAVIMDAFLREASLVLPYPDEMKADSIHDCLLRMAEELCGPMGRMISALMAESQFDPEIAAGFRDGYINHRRREGVAIVQRAIALGLIPPADPDVVLDLLYGPLYYRLMVGHQPLSRSFIAAHVDLVMQGLQLVPAAASPAREKTGRNRATAAGAVS